MKLKNFKIDKTRDQLVADVNFYQMDLATPVRQTIEAGEFDTDELPSWTKVAKNPIRAKGFLVRVLENLFKGTGDANELNVEEQLGTVSSQRVAMMFLPASTNNENMEAIGNITQQILPNYEVITLCGAMKYKGKRIANKNCERIVKELVESGKNVLVLSCKIGQRSFSIPQLDELYLAYDSGDEGSTIQKMSRALTPGETNKIGNIFSLSFDPNRSDVFDGLLHKTVDNYMKNKKIKSYKEGWSQVLQTLDIFKCTKNGRISFNGDDYLNQMLKHSRLSRILGKSINMNLLSKEDKQALAQGNVDYFKLGKQQSTKKGITGIKKNSNKKLPSKNEKNIEAKARQVVVSILENLDIIIYGTNHQQLHKAIDNVLANDDFKADIEAEFGVSADVIAYLIKNNVIKQEWVNVLYDKAV